MSKCPHCGGEHVPDAKFCTVTGKPLLVQPASAQETETMVTQSTPPAPQPARAATPQQPPAAPPKKRGIRPWLVVVLIVAFLVCIVVTIGGVLAWRGTQGEGPLAMLATATKTPRPTRTKQPTATPYPAVTEAPAAEPTRMPEATVTTALHSSDFYVGFVTDTGGINDNGFNQGAWEGLLLAADTYGIQVDYLESRSAAEYEDNIRLFAEIGADMIVTSSFLLGEATLAVAADYPEIIFLGTDQYQMETIPNVTGLMFDEWQAGFQAGVLAASLTRTRIIAGVYGTDLVPPVVAFAEGFEDGAHYYYSATTVLTTYHPGAISEAFVDPECGAAAALESIAQVADVIFGVGGLTGNGALIETATHDGKYCIGVDVDQWNTLPEAHGCLVSSAVKEFKESVFTAVGLAMSNSLPAGNYYGTTGLAPFHDFESEIPAETRNLLADIRTALLNGDIRYEDFH